MKIFLTILFLFRIVDSSILHAQSCKMDYGFDVQIIKTGQINISYLTLGKGCPVLFVHGLGGHAGHWKMNLQSISDAGYRAIAINLPGYGESELHAGIDADNQLKYYAAVIDTFIQVLHLDNVTIVGHSMGGQTAMLAALSHPRWLKQMVLAAPAGLEVFSGQEAALLKNFATPEFFRQQQDDAITKSFQSNFYRFPANAQHLVDERIAFKKCEKFIAYTQTVSAGVKGMLGAPVAGSFPIINIPVCIIAGKEDALIPNRILHPALTMQQLLDRASAEMKNVKVIQFSEAGHMLQWEACNQFNIALKRFLEDKF